MIHFQNASLRRGAKLLFSGADLQIYPGDCVGIVGRNGCGKSSLFKVFMDGSGIDSGDLTWPKSWRVSMMAQELYAHTGSALDYVIEGDTRRHALLESTAIAEASDDAEALVRIHSELDAIESWAAPTKAEQLLSGLGFKADTFANDVLSFSGGWRIRLNLARSLMEQSDLLLLDEPTNHLDIEAIAWLENWLSSYPGTLLMVSHDRDFLNTVSDKTLWFEKGKLALYRGTYQQAVRQKNERAAQLQASAEKQAEQIAHMEAFVRRFKAKASKAKQAQSRLKALERMSPIEMAPAETPFTFRLDTSESFSDPLLAVDHADIGFGTTPLLENISLTIRAGDRIGVLGVNGAGKSTLLKSLVDRSTLISGDIKPGEHLSIGYFAQHQMEALDLDASPITQIQRLNPRATEQSIRTFLGSFNFQEEAVADSIHHFSGGEKARLALALIAYQKPNLLILDEPTNHLDIEVRDALLLALQQFDGALIIVSHDRYLLRHSVDEFWIVANKAVSQYDGDLADYQQAIAAMSESLQPDETADAVETGANKKQRRQQAAGLRKQLAPLNKKIKKIESQMDSLNSEKEEYEQRLASTEIYQDSEKKQLATVLKAKGKVENTLFELEADWLAAQETLELMEEELSANE